MYTGLTGALLLRVKKNGQEHVQRVAYISGWSIEESTEIIETTKIGEVHKEGFAGMQSWSASADGAVVFEQEGNHQILFDLKKKGVKFSLQFFLDDKSISGSENSTYFVGDCYIESLSVDLSAEDKGNISIGVKGCGPLDYFVDGATTELNVDEWAVINRYKGDKGDKGDQGIPGGPPGPKGDKPAHKWSGTSVAFENPDGTTGSYVNLVGPTGAAGSTWCPAVNASGDLSWTLHSGTTAPVTVNIKGSKGDKGATGDKGSVWRPAVNASGDLSWTLNSGATTPTAMNIRGPRGYDGATGQQGPPGAAGDFNAMPENWIGSEALYGRFLFCGEGSEATWYKSQSGGFKDAVRTSVIGDSGVPAWRYGSNYLYPICYDADNGDVKSFLLDELLMEHTYIYDGDYALTGSQFDDYRIMITNNGGTQVRSVSLSGLFYYEHYESGLKHFISRTIESGITDGYRLQGSRVHNFATDATAPANFRILVQDEYGSVIAVPRNAIG